MRDPRSTDRVPADRGRPGRVRSRRRWALIVLVGALLVAVLARPVHVRGDRVDQRLWLWAWQGGSVTFTNSVTGAPVRIDFELRSGFDHLRMVTDEKTEHYYTSGTYDLNQRLSNQRTRSLDYCSVVGIGVTLASHHYAVEDSCLEIQLLWPPF